MKYIDNQQRPTMTKDKLELSEQELHLPNKEISNSHYSVPEGYFDALEQDIMQRIDNEIAQEEQRPALSLWTKLKPSLYLAATFASVYLSFRLLVPKPSQEQIPSHNSIAQIDTPDEDYQTYYESYANELSLQEESEEILALMH